MRNAHTTHKTAKPEFAAAGTKQTEVPACPACNHTRGFEVRMASIYECAACHGLYGRCYLGDSYTFVLPHMVGGPVPVEHQRYFDFTCVGSKGVTRRHGWFNPPTRLITQVG